MNKSGVQFNMDITKNVMFTCRSEHFIHGCVEESIQTEGG